MNLDSVSVAVTGAASGLGLAAAHLLVARNAKVILIDLPNSPGGKVTRELGAAAQFMPADVTDADAFAAALDAADEVAPLRGVVHCAGAGRRMRILDKNGNPAPSRTSNG